MIEFSAPSTVLVPGYRSKDMPSVDHHHHNNCAFIHLIINCPPGTLAHSKNITRTQWPQTRPVTQDNYMRIPATNIKHTWRTRTRRVDWYIKRANNHKLAVPVRAWGITSDNGYSCSHIYVRGISTAERARVLVWTLFGIICIRRAWWPRMCSETCGRAFRVRGHHRVSMGWGKGGRGMWVMVKWGRGGVY